MKKTLIALLALGSTLSGLAQGATGTVLTFTPSATFTAATDNWALNGQGVGPNTSWSDNKTLADGVKLTMELNCGKFGDVTPTNATWSNTTVINEFNSVFGTSITTTQLAALNYTAPKAQDSHATMTFNFSSAQGYTAGTEVVFYLLAAASNEGNNTDSISSITVGGLNDGYTVSWALREGTGYTTTATIPNNELGLIKVTGTLTENTAVSFVTNASKSGWAMAAYTAVVPEPATATLSLLALTGLAARRRRK
ncbi:MAG: PEP-CTERM sorting domain-containing protein [Akkermansia sp.]